MRHRSLLLLLLPAALAATVAACGGEKARPTKALASSAAVAPAESLLYLSIDADGDSAQWQAAQALLAKLPDREWLTERLLESFEEQGVDFERDVRPALGPEVGVVLLAPPGGEGEPIFVALTQPLDEAAFDALLAKGDEPSVWMEVGGWRAVAQTQAELDAFELARSKGVLADSKAFVEARDRLQDGALAIFSVDARRLFGVAGELGGLSRAGTLLGGDRALTVVGTLRTGPDGLRLEALASGESLGRSEPFEASLPSKLPAGALLYLGLSDLDAGFERARDQSGEMSGGQLDRQLRELELAVGITLDEDILPLFAGEMALVVYPGSPLPSVTLVLRPESPQDGVAALDQLASAAQLLLGELRRVDVDGVSARELRISDSLSLLYAAVDGSLVVSSSRDGVRLLGQPGARLAEDPEFVAAQTAAGMPVRTTGFLYVNIAQGIPAVESAQVVGGSLTPRQRRNLGPLRSLILYGSQSGGFSTTTLQLLIG